MNREIEKPPDHSSPPRRSLAIKMMAIFIGITVLTVLLISSVFINEQREFYLQEFQKRGETLVQGLAKNLVYGLLTNDHEDMENQIQSLLEKEEVVKVLLEGEGLGKIILFPKAKEWDQKVLSALSRGDRMPIQCDGSYIEVMCFQQVIEDTFESVEAFDPLETVDEKELGEVRIFLSMEDYKERLWRSIYKVVWLALALIIIFSAIALIIAQKLVTPINLLVEATQKIEKGEFQYRVHLKTQDELSLLADSFNQLSQTLESNEREIEEKKEALKENHKYLVQVEKMSEIGRVSAKIAHEIRNPILMIKYYLNYLRQKLQKEDISQDLLKQTLDHMALRADRIESFIFELLGYSKCEEELLEKVDIYKVTQALIEDEKAHYPGVEFQLRGSSNDSFKALANQERLEQVLMNLIQNAYQSLEEKYSPRPVSKEKIRLRVGKTTREGKVFLYLMVLDHGLGISDENLPKVFEAFFTTKSRNKGTGLGLNVCASIVKSFNGFIEVKSKVGRHSAFTIYIPQ